MSNENVNLQKQPGDLIYCLCGFFFPMVGLVLWLIWRDGTPKQKADAVLSIKGAIASMIMSILLVIFYIVVFIILAVLSEPSTFR